MAEVRLEHVKKIYEKNVLAVDDFTLDIADKEFMVFVGPSGCGKSTTLRMVAGLEEITAGQIYIGDTLVNDVPPKDRDVSMVFQNYALFPHMTVYENMAFALMLRKEKKAVIDKKVREVAEILEISDLLKRKPKALSGGQRQRVAIGRAIVRSPQVFLMDEPLSNLDAKLRNQMRTEIIKLRSRINTTFIYVTHDQTEAMTLGDRIVIMKDGLIQQVGTPQAVFDHPANLFVAGFIGTPQMNFFPGRLMKNGAVVGAMIAGHLIPLSEGKSISLQSFLEEEMVVGLRPECISIASGGEERSLSAVVDVVEKMGSTVHLHLLVEDQPIVAVLPTDAWCDMPRGSTLGLRFSSESLHFFHKSTEQSLF